MATHLADCLQGLLTLLVLRRVFGSLLANCLQTEQGELGFGYDNLHPRARSRPEMHKNDCKFHSLARAPRATSASDKNIDASRKLWEAVN